MGMYVQTPAAHGKADHLIRHHGAVEVSLSSYPTFDSVPEDKFLIIVADNIIFEAAAVAYCASEFAAFIDPRETRHRTYLLMDRNVAESLST